MQIVNFRPAKTSPERVYSDYIPGPGAAKMERGAPITVSEQQPTELPACPSMEPRASVKINSQFKISTAFSSGVCTGYGDISTLFNRKTTLLTFVISYFPYRPWQIFVSRSKMQNLNFLNGKRAKCKRLWRVRKHDTETHRPETKYEATNLALSHAKVLGEGRSPLAAPLRLHLPK